MARPQEMEAELSRECFANCDAANAVAELIQPGRVHADTELSGQDRHSADDSFHSPQRVLRVVLGQVEHVDRQRVSVPLLVGAALRLGFPRQAPTIALEALFRGDIDNIVLMAMRKEPSRKILIAIGR